MSFKEGFTAIEDIQNSGRRLSDTVSRIEALEGKLEGLLKAQARLSGLIGQVEGILTELKNSSNDLATEHARTSEQVQELPSRVASVVAEAEQRIEDRQVHIAVLVDELPRLVDTALKKRLPGLLEGMEARLRDQLRGELKDTRSAIRDTLEVTSNKQEKSLERLAGDIISEMPRGLLGRRGK